MPSVAVNGITINCQLDGPEGAPVLMFSNSLASNLSMWDPQIPAFADRFRILRYDSRGHGKSDAPTGDYTIELLAEDAVALMDHFGFDKVHFCGLSKGGMVGQMLGHKHGDRLISLTLCDTSSHMAAEDIWTPRIKIAREQGMAALVEPSLDRWITKPGQARLPETADAVRAMIGSTPVDGYCGCCAAIREMDQREGIKQITAPTLVIVGADDESTPVSAAEFIRDQIGGAELVVIDSAAHVANLEQPEAFNEALGAFLAKH